MNSLMSMRTMAFSSSNSTSARALHSSVLPTPVGPQEDERADRPVGVLQAAAAAADGVGDGLDRFVLADDALVQPLFEHQQLGPFGFQHAGDGDAGPGADDFGDFLGADFLAQQAARAAGFAGCRRSAACLRFGFFELLGELLPLRCRARTASGRRSSSTLAGRLLLLDRGGELVVLRARPRPAAAARRRTSPRPSFSRFPLLAEAGQLLAQLGHLVFDLGEPLLGVLFGFVGQLPGGQFQLRQPALHLVDLVGHAFQLHRQPAGGLVHQVDGLVGQEAVGDVAVRELGRGHQGRVLDLHALVMGFVARLEAAEDGDRVLDGRLADEHRLEAALERGVLFDVLAILVERRRADAAQLAAGQGRLEQVGGVAAAFGRAGADDGVQLVDEQDDVAARRALRVSTALSRSSNSPRNFVPAISAPMSSAIDALVLEALAARRPATIRRASPSAIAVLPTPGSPISTGLFFVRRESTWITRRISWSRPITGSSLPCRARSTRSMPYFSQGLELALGVLVGHAGAAADGLQRAEQLVFR